MATVKKIKKAQSGVSCKWSKGEKVCTRTPLREKIANLRGSMQVAKEERQAKREERRNPRVATDEGFERDFPEGASAPGLWGETKGSKETRWKSELKKGGKILKKAAPKKVVAKAKYGKKIVNKSKKK